MASMPSKVKTYESESHGHGVVDGFQRLWANGQLCDTKLKAQDKSFSVHRCFLSSCSEYFYTMFSEDFKESHQTEVDLKGVTAVGLEALITFAYTGKISIDQDNLHQVLEAASHLQFTEVQTFCSKYLKEEITIENCLDFLRMAELYTMPDCKEETKHFILAHFVPIAQSEDFNEISLDLLCELISSDRLNARKELDVFNMALKWLSLHRQGGSRLCHAERVLGLIRYGLMDPEQMEKVYSTSVMLTEPCQMILQEALNYHLRLFAQPVLAGQSHIAQMRAYQESVLVLGAGMLNNSLCSQTMAAVLDSKGTIGRLDTLFDLKERRYFAAVAVINEFVYVVGGQTAMAGDGSHASSTVFRFNARDGKWLQISSMSVPRTHFALVALENGLLAIGGKNNRLALDTAELYDYNLNEWHEVHKLPTTLFSHAGCCFDKQVYISGGCPGEDFTDECYKFDVHKNMWHQLRSMNQSRGYHVMVTHDRFIYALAGNSNAGDRHDVLDAERYDVSTDHWTVLRSSNLGQSEAPAVKAGSSIYILGGYSWDAHSFQDTIQCYNIDTDSWECYLYGLPEPMTGLVACSVKLPTSLYHQYNHHYCDTDTNKWQPNLMHDYA